MRVQRSKLRAGFVQIPNAIARHGRLSLEARGLLVYLLSLPDGTGATVEKVCAVVPNGRRSVSKAMNELIEAGYVKRAKLQDPETGRWVTITTVTDTPESEATPTDRMPTVGTPTGQAVGGSPIGSKTGEEKNTTPPPAKAVQEAAPQAAESAEKGGEGEKSFLAKIDREMRREARLTLERLSIHSRLYLTDQEISRLAPKVVPWLKDGFTQAEILQCLTSALPDQINSVAGLVTHRLNTFTPARSVQPETPKTHVPVQRATCEVCERPFRLGHPGGICGDCQAEMDRAAEFFAA